MVFLLNSAPGVGKSTLLKLLQERLVNGFAFLDGDDVGRVTPLENSLDWLNMIQDNIVSCCVNFRRYNKKHVVVCFVFPSEERIQRLKGLLVNEGFEVMQIALFCEDSEIKRRILERNTSKLINVPRAIELNASIRELKSDFKLNSNSISPDEVAEQVSFFILSKV